MATNSELKAKVTDAISEKADYSEIIELIRNFKSRGGGQRVAYETIEEIWKEYGFDDFKYNNNKDIEWLKDELEYVMEVVWRFCPYQPQLWDTTLTNR